MKAIRFIAVLCLLITGCGYKVNVVQDFDPEANFDAFKTYAWMPESELPDGHQVNTAGGRELSTLISFVMDEELVRRGLTKDEDNPDLLVSFWVGINAMSGLEEGVDYASQMENYTAYNAEGATLMIDLIDAQTREFVWRGGGATRVRVDPTVEMVETDVRSITRQILAHYPPNTPSGSAAR